MLKKFFLTLILCVLTLPVLAGGSGEFDNLTCTFDKDNTCLLDNVSPTVCGNIGGHWVQDVGIDGKCGVTCTMGNISCPGKDSGDTWHDVDGKEGMEQNDECSGTYNIAGTDVTCKLPDQNPSPIYRCKAGYWGDPNVDSGNCTKCPSWNELDGYSDPEDLDNNKTYGGNTTKDKCCVPGFDEANHVHYGNGFVKMDSGACCIQITQ